MCEKLIIGLQRRFFSKARNYFFLIWVPIIGLKKQLTMITKIIQTVFDCRISDTVSNRFYDQWSSQRPPTSLGGKLYTANCHNIFRVRVFLYSKVLKYLASRSSLNLFKKSSQVITFLSFLVQFLITSLVS